MIIVPPPIPTPRRSFLFALYLLCSSGLITLMAPINAHDNNSSSKKTVNASNTSVVKKNEATTEKNTKNKIKPTATNRTTILRRLPGKNDRDIGDHFDYVNPQAPKGGTIRLSDVGSWDNFNPFVVTGLPGHGISMTMGSLMIRDTDMTKESFTIHASVAKEVELEPDYSAITFYLNPKAKFHDGTCVTANDVKVTIRTLQEKGLPRYQHYYDRIQDIKVIDDRTIKITFRPLDNSPLDQPIYNPELPLIIATCIVLSKNQLDSVDFLNMKTPLIGCGPYKINREKTKIGQQIVYQRIKDYWGKDIPVMKGMWNFDEIIIEYCKTLQTQFQLFTAGQSDIFFETNPQNWEKAYNFPATQENKVKKIDIKHQRPVLVRTILFNMKDPRFQDWRIRKALSLVLDFDKINKILFLNAMNRPTSMFANTSMAPHATPQFDELAVYKGLKNPIEDSVYKHLLDHDLNASIPYDQCKKQAIDLLKQAGLTLKNGRWIDDCDKEIEFEILFWDPKLEKIAGRYKDDLKKIGIPLHLKLVDRTTYENMVNTRKFCMIFHNWANSMSPGDEQVYYFSPEKADIDGSSNYGAIKDKVAEELSKTIVKATSQEDLETYVHAFDRYISNQYYQVFLSYDNHLRFAYWADRIAFKPIKPKDSFNILATGWSIKSNFSAQ